MKKLLATLALAPLAVTACGGSDAAEATAMTKVAYSYKSGEAATSNQRVKSEVTVKSGVIQDIKFAFEKITTNGAWDSETISRRDDKTISATRNSNAFAGLSLTAINSSDTTDDIAGIGTTSMFDITATDMMSTYAAVSDGTNVSVAIMGAESRMMYEAVINKTSDAAKGLDDLDWKVNKAHYSAHKGSDAKIGTTPFNFGDWEKVAVANGVFKGLSTAMDSTSTAADLIAKLEAAGMKDDSKVVSGFHSLGGWYGNYRAIEASLKGKNVNNFKYLWNYDGPQLGSKPNETTGNITGSTNIQDSTNGISGATVRTSRENHAFQLALVELGFLKSNEVFEVKW